MQPAAAKSLSDRGAATRAAMQPAQITPCQVGNKDVPGALVLDASTGTFRRVSESLVAGGMLPDYQLGFRVLRSAFAVAPKLGDVLFWRVPPETAYRAHIKIAQILDNPAKSYLALACVNINK